jgi:hypothetical protein
MRRRAGDAVMHGRHSGVRAALRWWRCNAVARVQRRRRGGAEGAGVVAQRALVRWRAGGGRRRRGSSAGGARVRLGARSDARRQRCSCARAADVGGAVAVQTARAADGDGANGARRRTVTGN